MRISYDRRISESATTFPFSPTYKIESFYNIRHDFFICFLNIKQQVFLEN